MTLQHVRRVGGTLTLVVSAYCVLTGMLRKNKMAEPVERLPLTILTSTELSSPIRVFESGTIRFDFLTNERRLCAADENSNPSTPFLLIIVQSHAANKLSRDAIRDTWGKISRDYFRKKPVRLMFVLGNFDKTKYKSKVRKESRSYKDLISADFVDTYGNLTLKSLAGFYWARQFCPHTKYILKTDDNMYHNVSSLLRWLTTENSNITAGIVGRLHVDSTVYRYGPWKVDRRVYPSTTYPPYCAGCAYLLSLSMAERLLESARRVPLLPVEDVYITGLLAKAVGSRCSNNFRFSEWNNGPTANNICMMFRGDTFSVHNVDHARMYAIYRNSQIPEWCAQNEYRSRKSNSGHVKLK